MTDFDREAFLDWLDQKETYHIKDKEVRERWPGFYDNYQMVGITVMYEGGDKMVPVRDYENAVRYGVVLD